MAVRHIFLFLVADFGTLEHGLVVHVHLGAHGVNLVLHDVVGLLLVLEHHFHQLQLPLHEISSFSLLLHVRSSRLRIGGKHVDEVTASARVPLAIEAFSGSSII